MIERLFSNRRHRLYFELVDSFRSSRCSLCYLLSQKEQAIITGCPAPDNQRARRGIVLKALCVLHKARVKKTLGDDPSFLGMLKTALVMSLRQLAHPPGEPTPKWRRWRRASAMGCPLCRQLLSREKNLCRALIQFLADTDFWKGFQTAPLLCLDHLEKCLAIPARGRGFERLVQDQRAKLNALINDLVRFEATGTNEESKVAALEWLADFAGPSVIRGGGVVSSVEDDTLTEVLSQENADRSAGHGCDQEEFLFENEKLRRKNQDLIDRLKELETRAASLHYRVADLSEVNKRLEMGYTGASTQARGMEKLVRDLRDEIKKLKEGSAEQRTKAVS